MTNGPRIQFKATEMPMCFHKREVVTMAGRVSYLILVRAGHIITISPIAIAETDETDLKLGNQKGISILTKRYTVELGGIQSFMDLRSEFAKDHPDNHRAEHKWSQQFIRDAQLLEGG